MFLAGKPFENVYSNEWTIDLIARQKALNFTPGERHLYSNSGYYLLAQIVERATGKSLREYADEKIFKPLGMVHTHFHDDRGLVVRNRAMAYEPGDGGEFRLDWYPNFDKVGSGGLLTTVEDLLLWDRAFYSDVLGDGFVDQMLDRGKLSNGETLDYAFGLTRGEVRGLATVSHGGAFMGFRAELLRFPEQHLSVACLCNLGSTNPSAMAREVASLYLGDVMEPEEEARSGDDEPEEETIERAKAELEPLTGHYWSAEEGLLREIRLEEGTLMYVRTEESKSPLGPRADGSFRMLEVPVRVDVRFKPSSESPERMVVTVEGDDPTELVRVEPASRTIEELSAYAGHYYSEELDAEYVIRLDNGSLQIASGPLEVERLEPVSGETFTAGAASSVEFARSGDGDVSGFTLDAGRVRGLGFIRRND